ncbi:hypothetical protein LshimejAT787_0805740 [Lyophyllum shimeji]|uniref:Uncharacterized protein n=1 Tax=Lyophyllum shimeji TaxID=47721 RepID=A0A9P3UPI4_LYOSH|nr:hypothetical protein LshimejAT787_0805740 [Lyophyllum shimeji]
MHTLTSCPLCDYCHQKPRYANHRYCSKTCASQAGPAAASAPVKKNNSNSNLCIQCQTKPKFRGFDFCGKTCAAAANPQGRNPTGPAKGPNPLNTQQPAFNNAAQVAQFVAQQVPQVKAFLAALNSVAAPQAVPQPQPQPQAPFTVPFQAAAPQNNPFLQPQAPTTFPLNVLSQPSQPPTIPSVLFQTAASLGVERKQ